MVRNTTIGSTPWCNGSTTGFGPVSLGSNPGGVAIFFDIAALSRNNTQLAFSHAEDW